jgi:alanyl-tRNA synthetase
MTIRRYYEESYTTRFTAPITEHTTHNGHPAAVLAETWFYPTGGGQPHDRGHINHIPVIEVLPREADGAVLHLLESALTGDTAEAQIDWTRRFDFMQQHTAQHILTQAFVQTCRAQTVGFHLTPENLTIDLDQTDIPDSTLAAVELLCNQIIQENRAVTAHLRHPDSTEDVRVRRLPKQMLTEGLRLITIADFDVTACGGTHVRHTGEIGLLKMLKLEKRSGKTRVEFMAGGRAVRDYAAKHHVISTLAADMDCTYPETIPNLAKLRAELKHTQSALKDTRAQLIPYEVAHLRQVTAPAAPIIQVYADRELEELKLLAAALTAGEGSIIFLATLAPKPGLIFARSAEGSHHMGALLKQAAEALGGRGGGQPHFAQGGFATTDADQVRQVLQSLITVD